MADILRITTPLVDKNPIQPNKQVTDPNIPFPLTDLSKVVKPGQESSLLAQNNGMVPQEEAPAILMDMLKDPSVTVGFLKNIYLLQEIINLLPINNLAMTQEIRQLFSELLLQPEMILPELLRQETASTSFKGELFDFLRQTLQTQGNAPELRYGVTNLLKSLNALFYREDILHSISNSMVFLSESMGSSKDFSTLFATLAQQFRAPDAAENFPQLRDAVLAALRDMEGSILYSPKLQKIAPMIIYNLSRFNDNPDFIREALHNLMTLVDGAEQKETLMRFVQQRIDDGTAMRQENRSQVMDILAKIIQKQSGNAELAVLSSDKIERIVHSLLSSPCNFTPLLHFIIPVQDGDVRSFAEIWIDQEPEETEKKKGKGQEQQAHVLIEFDVEGIGQFEAELYLVGHTLSVQLFCPAPYVQAFSGIGSAVSGALAGTDYRFSEIKIEKLERQRSLMDVFKTLPHKRTGVNVTV